MGEQFKKQRRREENEHDSEEVKTDHQRGTRLAFKGQPDLNQPSVHGGPFFQVAYALTCASQALLVRP